MSDEQAPQQPQSAAPNKRPETIVNQQNLVFLLKDAAQTPERNTNQTRNELLPRCLTRARGRDRGAFARERGASHSPGASQQVRIR